MKTEAEARQCWCPFVRMRASYEDGPDETGYNRHNLPSDRGDETHEGREFNCIASECMAWRWGYQGHDAGDFPNTAEDPDRGYCGLAGKS